MNYVRPNYSHCPGERLTLYFLRVAFLCSHKTLISRSILQLKLIPIKEPMFRAPSSGQNAAPEHLFVIHWETSALSVRRARFQMFKWRCWLLLLLDYSNARESSAYFTSTDQRRRNPKTIRNMHPCHDLDPCLLLSPPDTNSKQKKVKNIIYDSRRSKKGLYFIDTQGNQLELFGSDITLREYFFYFFYFRERPTGSLWNQLAGIFLALP